MARIGLLFFLWLAAWPVMAAQDKTVLMVLWRGPTEIEAIFKERLAALGVRVNYVEIVAGQDRGRLGTLLRNLEDDIAAGKFDLVYSYGSTVTEVVAGTFKGRVPVVFNIVFNPVAAQFVQSLARPGGTITGVTNGTPVESQLDMYHRLKPFKSLCLIFNAREFNSGLILESAKNWAARNGVTLYPRRVAPDTPAMEAVLAELASGKLPVDAVYAGADSYVASRADLIREALGDRLALFGGTETYMARGWLAAYAPTFESQGRAAAEQAAKILGGANPATLPVILPDATLIVSKSAAAKLGVSVPAGSVIKP